MKYTVLATVTKGSLLDEYVLFMSDDFSECVKVYKHECDIIKRDKKKNEEVHIVETEAWEDGNYNYLENNAIEQTFERRECETMPFDKDGCHATGYEVFDGSVWWAEYKDKDGNVFLAN